MRNQAPVSAQSFYLSLGQPEHGWLPVWLELGEHHEELDVSDVLADPVGELAAAGLLAASDRDGRRTVTFFLEPEFAHLMVEKKGADVVLRYGPGGDVPKARRGRVLVECHLRRHAFASRVWRALHQAEASLRAAHDDHWGYPYPAAEVRELDERSRLA